MHTKLDVLGELFIELLPAVLIFSKFFHQVHAFLDQVLSDDLKNLVLLEHFSGNVQWEIFGVNNTLDEVEIFRDEFFAVVHDKNSSDIKLDVVLGFLVFEQIEGSSFWDEKKGTEFKLSFD